MTDLGLISSTCAPRPSLALQPLPPTSRTAALPRLEQHLQVRPIASASARSVLPPTRATRTEGPCTTCGISVYSALVAFLPPYPHTPYAALCRAPLARAIYPATPSVSDKRYRHAALPAHTHYRALQSCRLFGVWCRRRSRGVECKGQAQRFCNSRSQGVL